MALLPAPILRTPVFLYQMGKVGSSSIEAVLKRDHRGPVYRAHGFVRLPPEAQRALAWRRRWHLPIRIISPVRDPIARNISAFFENFERDTGVAFASRHWDIGELRELFLRHAQHNVPLDWFDRQLRTTFDVDVFAQAFDVVRRWSVFRRGAVQVLVYRTDLASSEQHAVIGRFLNTSLGAPAAINVAADKPYAEAYAAFCEGVSLPDIYVKVMCESRYCRHFWTREEIDAIRRRWQRHEAPARTG